MAKNPFKKKTGLVVLLDALGASNYTGDQIEHFLHSRNDISLAITELSALAKEENDFRPPSIFTFGGYHSFYI